jgi:hypothetical protein
MESSTNRKRHRPEEVIANVRQADEVILHLWCAAYRLHYNHRQIERAPGTEGVATMRQFS